jgi:hypothetical protein
MTRCDIRAKEFLNKQVGWIWFKEHAHFYVWLVLVYYIDVYHMHMKVMTIMK